MPGKAATMLIVTFLSLVAVTYAITLTDWAIGEPKEKDDDYTVIEDGLLYRESTRYEEGEDDRIDSITIGTLEYDAKDACADERLRKELYCEHLNDVIKSSNFTLYGLLAGIGLGVIGISMGVFTTKGLNPKISAILITLSGILIISSAAFFHQSHPGFSTFYGDKWADDFGLGLWITFAAGGAAVVASIFGYISKTQDHYY